MEATVGPVMLDLDGTTLTAEEHELLQHPLVGGVIFFARNYEHPQQLQDLVRDTRAASGRSLLLAVDQEGGRVRRFREGFSALPAMGQIYPCSSGDLPTAMRMAYDLGWLMAAEILAMDIDLSFAPVLDVAGPCEAIGDRSFHAEPEVIVQLAAQFIDGMRLAGMKSTGKHFPGHGSVQADSHFTIPVDERPADAVYAHDLSVFSQLIQQNKLDAVMPAHVIFPTIDALPAGFSPTWLQTILREQLGFNGVIFSDDLSMEAAGVAGGPVDRAQAALAAGCDMVLACNNRAGATAILDQLTWTPSAAQHDRLQTLLKPPAPSQRDLQQSPMWHQATTTLDRFPS